MQIEQDKSAAANLRFAIKFIDFSAMEQKFADPFGRRNFVTGALVRLDVRVVEKGFAILDSGEGVVDVGFSSADRFYLAAPELEPGFIALKNVEIAKRLTVENRLGSHNRAMSAKIRRRLWTRSALRK